MEDLTAVPDSGLGWLDASGDFADIVLSTRVRLARNVQGHAFGPRARVNDREAVLGRVRSVTDRVTPLRSSSIIDLAGVDMRTRKLLLERRIVSRDHLSGDNGKGPPRGTAVVLASRDPLSIMVNEEDHLRLQVLVSG